MRCDEADALLDALADSTVDNAVDDAVDEASRAPLSAHLAECARCRAALESARRLSFALAAMPRAEPSAAADARALAAVAEERAWAAWRRRARRTAIAVGGVAAAACVIVALYVAAPAAPGVADLVSSLVRAGESWLRYGAAPALEEARGTLVAALVLLVVIALIERSYDSATPSARTVRPPRA